MADQAADRLGTMLEELGVRFELVIEAVTGFGGRIDSLGIDSISCSPVNVGSGTVQTEHGMLPVPAPATARLLANAPVYSHGPAVELATPTGAAIVATLVKGFGAMPAMTITRTGYGAGTKDFPGQPAPAVRESGSLH